MSNLRLFLLLGLALLGLQLWSAWQADYGPKPEPAAVAESPDAAAPAGDVPTPAAATECADRRRRRPSRSTQTFAQQRNHLLHGVAIAADTDPATVAVG